MCEGNGTPGKFLKQEPLNIENLANMKPLESPQTNISLKARNCFLRMLTRVGWERLVEVPGVLVPKHIYIHIFITIS